MFSIVLASLLVAGCAMQEELPSVTMGKAQLVFLKRPRVEREMFDEDWGNMKSDHVAFLGELLKTGRALFLGYQMEPSASDIEDILVIDVASGKDAEKLLSSDPCVRAKQLEIETHTWFFARNYLTKPPKPTDFSKYWFGMLERVKPYKPKLSKEEGQRLQDGHMANIQKMANERALLLAGPMEEPTDFRGVFIFKDMPRSGIEELISVDPMIKSGRLKLSVYRIVAGKGSFLIEPHR